MLTGNPDTFAIWCDAVDAWSTDRFKNGCFAYFVGGELIVSLGATLGVEFNLLSGMNCINDEVVDERLFNLPPSSAYAELVEKAFPEMDSEAEESDYKHLVSLGSLLDEGHQIFLVESGNQAKLIFGNRKKGNPREHILKRGEFQSVVLATLARAKM